MSEVSHKISGWGRYCLVYDQLAWKGYRNLTKQDGPTASSRLAVAVFGTFSTVVRIYLLNIRFTFVDKLYILYCTVVDSPAKPMSAVMTLFGQK